MQNNKIYESVKDFCKEGSVGQHYDDHNDVYQICCEIEAFHIKISLFPGNSCIIESKVQVPDKSEDELNVIANKISDIDESMFCNGYDGVLSLRSGFSEDTEDHMISAILKKLKILRELDMSLESIKPVPFDTKGFNFGDSEDEELDTPDVEDSVKEDPENVPEEISENSDLVEEKSTEEESIEATAEETISHSEEKFSTDSAVKTEEKSISTEDLLSSLTETDKSVPERAEVTEGNTQDFFQEPLKEMEPKNPNTVNFSNVVNEDPSLASEEEAYQKLLKDLGISPEFKELNAVYDQRDYNLKMKAAHLQERTETIRQIGNLFNAKLAEAEKKSQSIILEATESAKNILNEGYKKAQIHLNEKQSQQEDSIRELQANAEIEIGKKRAALREEREAFAEEVSATRQALDSQKHEMAAQILQKQSELDKEKQDLESEKRSFEEYKKDIQTEQKKRASILELRTQTLKSEEARLNQIKDELEYKSSDLQIKELSFKDRERRSDVRALNEQLNQKDSLINSLANKKEELTKEIDSQRKHIAFLESKNTNLLNDAMDKDEKYQDLERQVDRMKNQVSELNAENSRKESKIAHLEKIVSEKEKDSDPERLKDNYLSELQVVRISVNVESKQPHVLSGEKNDCLIRVNTQTGMLCIERIVDHSESYMESIQSLDSEDMNRIYSVRDDSIMCCCSVSVTSVAESCLNILSSLQDLEPNTPEHNQEAGL